MVLTAALSVSGGVSADEPPAVVLDLPPLAVPTPPQDKPATVPPAAAPAALDTLPPLSSPVPVPVAPTPVAAAPVLEIPPDRRPVLVVPGLPTPRAVAPVVGSTNPGVLRLPTGRQDALERPSGMTAEPSPTRTATPASTGGDPLSTDGPPPMVGPTTSIASLPADGPPPLVPPNGDGAIPEGRPRLELPTARHTTALTPGTPARGEALDPLPARRNATNTVDAGVVTAPPEGTRAPSRRRLLDLFRPPTSSPVEPPPSPVVAGEPTRIDPRHSDPIQVEPRSDPAADAALKRRLEAQIQASLGGQLRALDVRVVDRTVHVRAAVTRFWQKRAVRRTLETLPALAGYRARIEVID